MAFHLFPALACAACSDAGCSNNSLFQRVMMLMFSRRKGYALAGSVLALALVAEISPGQGVESAMAALVKSAEEYQAVIASLDSADTDRSRTNRHLAQLALLLPESVARQVAEGDLLHAPGEATLRAGAGERLLAWWRRQDPLPASPLNERLLEHVQRVQHAEVHFASDAHPTGFDDRGVVYVRYGRPERELVVKFDEPEFTDKLYGFGLIISPSDFPDNVFWRFGHIDATGNFLFLKQDGEYRLSPTVDFLPRSLRTGFTPEKRGQRRSEVALAAMHTIYRQLSAEDPQYLDRFSQVDNYLSNIEGPGRVASRVLGVGFRRQVLDQDDFTELQPGGSAQPVNEVIQGLITSSTTEDQQMIFQRTQLMPPAYTEVHRTLPAMPVEMRTARFLDRDGTTRTELYWSPQPGVLHRTDAQEDYVLHVTALQMGPGYDRGAATTQSIQVTDLPRSSDTVIPAQQTVVRGDTGLYHIAMQWDLHRLEQTPEGLPAAGARVRFSSEHVDSLRALDGSGTALEMSDLKPVMIWSAVELVGDSDPYPYTRVGADMPLGLYFEIYNLRYDEDDYTRYSVTYQIARQMAPNRRGRAPTSVMAEYTGTRSNESQEVLLDLTDWQGAGPVLVTVTVRDWTSQTSVVRSLPFDIQ